MANRQPSIFQKKIVFHYILGSISGIILCILGFSLNNANIPFWCIVIFIGIYCACIVLACLTYSQRRFIKLQQNHEKQISVLRHDVKGILSPALLMADRILLNKSADERTIQSAESIAQSIEKVAEYLRETKES